jgi:hypothetical protein
MSKYERIKSSENKNYRYRTTVFIICLLVSALLWLTIKFSSDYTVEIPYSINLKGIPEGKVLVNQPDSVLRINVKVFIILPIVEIAKDEHIPLIRRIQR